MPEKKHTLAGEKGVMETKTDDLPHQSPEQMESREVLVARSKTAPSYEASIKCESCPGRVNERLDNLPVNPPGGESKWDQTETTAQEKIHFSERGFHWSTDLGSHARSRSGRKVHKCSECGKDFRDKGALRKHERVLHTGEKPYKCSLCEKSFGNSSNFTAHEQNHKGEKLYKCLACNRRFSRRGILVRHEKIHTRRKLLKCAWCAKYFADRSNQAVHERIHKGEKPYQCSECGKSFNQKGNLMMHKRIHTGERPFMCAECGRSFSQKGNLSKHAKMHMREKPHERVEQPAIVTE
nr:zinc finger protein 32-like [Pogona vitticeps]